jgi:hypothetical protein
MFLGFGQFNRAEMLDRESRVPADEQFPGDGKMIILIDRLAFHRHSSSRIGPYKVISTLEWKYLPYRDKKQTARAPMESRAVCVALWSRKL